MLQLLFHVTNKGLTSPSTAVEVAGHVAGANAHVLHDGNAGREMGGLGTISIPTVPAGTPATATHVYPQYVGTPMQVRWEEASATFLSRC